MTSWLFYVRTSTKINYTILRRHRWWHYNGKIWCKYIFVFAIGVFYFANEKKDDSYTSDSVRLRYLKLWWILSIPSSQCIILPDEASSGWKNIHSCLRYLYSKQMLDGIEYTIHITFSIVNLSLIHAWVLHLFLQAKKLFKTGFTERQIHINCYQKQLPHKFKMWLP